MTAVLGHTVVLWALIVALCGSVVSFVSTFSRRPSLAVWGRRAAALVLGLTVLATLLMEYALLTHDFSVKYVYDVGSRQTPLYYTVISLWGALEGSILFWALLLSGYTVAFLASSYRRFPGLQGPVGGILLGISSFFLFVIAGPGNPFVRLDPAPRAGHDLNPLLQNHWMMGVHPVLLYLGYVGLAVPFAIAMGALFQGTPGPSVLQLIRRWALIPWVMLSLGIVAGMWWSYAVLGWGGYWAWDPVENASVMPWLVTTAFLHSLQVHERRGMLKTWTLSLIVAAFLLSILGTFLTRSGVLESVHSFTQSGVGPIFLGFFAVVLIGSLGLLLARSPDLEAPGTLEASICRETAFMFNNLFLVALTFTILLGTMFPLIAEALQGSRLSVGAPYFNHVAVPIGFALLFLMGLGPALPWGASRLEDVQYRLLAPVMTGVGLIFVLLLMGVRGRGALVTFGMAAFVLTVTVERVRADMNARRGRRPEKWTTAMQHLVRANPRRYGGYVVHLGVLLMIIGIAASQVYGARASATLHRGESVSVSGYHVTFTGWRAHFDSNRMVIGAAVDVTRGRERVGTLVPSQNLYLMSGQTVPAPAVREEPFDMIVGLFQGRNPLPNLGQLLQGHNPFEDTYVVLQAYNPYHRNINHPKSTATIQVLINPMIGFIWVGGGIIGLGGAVALLPARHRRRVVDSAPERVRIRPQPDEVTV
ncbi:MAG: heme lyase CcmF/NrfE family subunit [Chloroflexota bacterium]